MTELKKILDEVRPDIDFEKETALIDNGELDSFDVISIIEALSKTFNVEVEVDDLTPENFNSMEAIWKLVKRLQDN